MTTKTLMINNSRSLMQFLYQGMEKKGGYTGDGTVWSLETTHLVLKKNTPKLMKLYQ